MEHKIGDVIRFTIPIPPVSKKNSQEIAVNRYTGKRFVMPSKTYRDYEAQALWFLPKTEEPISAPVNVKCLFYRARRGNADVVNYLEAADDLFVKGGLIKDDNCSIVVSHDGSRVRYDKDNPRTEVEIEFVEADAY